MKTIKSFVYSILLVVLLIAPLFSTHYLNAETGNKMMVLDKYRVGAICCDGWESSATGRGACSHHNGVKYWIYYNDETDEYTYVSTGRCD